VRAKSNGECAVMCPACPHPGKNLPSDWEKAEKPKAWIYALFLVIDANFHLKRLPASSNTRDPSLNQGSAYFVKEVRYKEFLNVHTHRNIEEASTCNNYDAVKSASIRRGKGTTASGMGTIECSQHDMKRPVSVGDLQKGEWYVARSYIRQHGLFVFLSINHHSPTSLVVSYDIACQWSRNLLRRLDSYPSDFVGTHAKLLNVRYLVPKFHLYAHRTHCQINYSFNLTPGVGRTDREAPKRGWAAMNPVSSSTKEMGPGSRRDTLDDHFRDYNWQKVIVLYNTMLKKVQEAVAMRAEHVEHFKALSDSLPLATISKFTSLIQAWEAGKSQDNPYEATVEAMSAAKVRLQLMQEDTAITGTDDASPTGETISPSLLLAQGLDLKEHQAHLQLDVKALPTSPTETQLTQITDHQTRLMCRITAWQSTQELLVPGVTLRRCRMNSESTTASFPEDIDLMLPLTLPSNTHIDNKFHDYEWCLHTGQAHNNLADNNLTDIQQQLLILSLMYQSKDRFIHGQQHNTRSATLISYIQAQINFSKSRYRANHAVLLVLSGVLGKSGWATTLLPLEDSDIRSLRAGDDASSSEGQRTLSWTVKQTNDQEMSETMSEALRIERCKSRAQAHRWQEEGILLKEEMCRILQFHRWQAQIWKEHADRSEVTSGAHAYAMRQRHSRETLVSSCVDAWKDVDQYMSLGDGVAATGKPLVEVSLSCMAAREEDVVPTPS
ncbi:hypothetical protein BDN71DRAFT_1398332, partial [Pleurotus eryngii]